MPNPSVSVAMTLEQCWHRVPGGTAVAALGMARALGRRADVQLVGVAAAHRKPAPVEWRPQIPVRNLPLPRPLLYEAWHRLRRPAVESATGPIDVIHATTMAMPPRTAPVVMTVHDLAFLHEPAHFTRRGMRFFRRGLQLAMQEADVVVCPSAATRDDCERVGFERQRLRLVPLGVEQTKVSAADIARARKRHGLERPYILWTGTIEPRKNLPRLLQAYRGLGEPEVDLALAGPRGWNEDLSKLVNGLEDRVRPLGFVPHSELAALYAGAEVFCFPSLLEGFGFPVIEAMAQGTPVVTSRGTSTAELAADAGVLVDPLDPTSIGEGLRSVLRDGERRDRMSREGRKRAATFTWNRTAQELAAIYQELVA